MFVSSTGSGSGYWDLRKLLNNKGVKEVCLKPISVPEHKDRTDKIKKGTKVKYIFIKIPTEAHHRWNAPAKRAFGDVTFITDHNHSDNGFSISVSKALHAIITKFENNQRPEYINYQT